MNDYFVGRKINDKDRNLLQSPAVKDSRLNSGRNPAFSAPTHEVMYDPIPYTPSAASTSSRTHNLGASKAQITSDHSRSASLERVRTSPVRGHFRDTANRLIFSSNTSPRTGGRSSPGSPSLGSAAPSLAAPPKLGHRRRVSAQSSEHVLP